MAKENPYLDFSAETLASAIQQAVMMLSSGYRSAHLEKELDLMETAMATKGNKTLDYSDDFEG